MLFLDLGCVVQIMWVIVLNYKLPWITFVTRKYAKKCFLGFQLNFQHNFEAQVEHCWNTGNVSAVRQPIQIIFMSVVRQPLVTMQPYSVRNTLTKTVDVWPDGEKKDVWRCSLEKQFSKLTVSSLLKARKHHDSRICLFNSVEADGKSMVWFCLPVVAYQSMLADSIYLACHKLVTVIWCQQPMYAMYDQHKQCVPALLVKFDEGLQLPTLSFIRTSFSNMASVIFA